MMAGNPSWWSMDYTSNLRSPLTPSDHHHHHHHHHHHQEISPNFLVSQTHPYSSSNHNSKDNNSFLPLQYLHGSSTCSPLPFSSLLNEHHHAQDFPHSLSQLLLVGLGDDHQQEEIFGSSLFQSTRVMTSGVVDVKQELNDQNKNNNSSLYGYNHHDHHDHHHKDRETNGNNIRVPASSPKSCVTSLSSTNNILDFSSNKRSLQEYTPLNVENSNSECNSTATGGVPIKKPKLQSSSNPPLKVRKEKLGDRITALHQLVSPFGKTDTASVLLEAIGYIRFLQGQIEALSSPYLGSNNGSSKHLYSEKQDVGRDLKSRGLCLAPISCTQLVGSDNGADYWAPSLGGGF